MSDYTIRPAAADDRDFVLATAERLASFVIPPWRTAHEICEGEARTLRVWFDGAANGTLLVAESNGARAGFIFLERQIDYFTQRAHAHIGMLAVTTHAEGIGIGRALLEAAERWAHDAGYDRITLHAFEGNARARAIYERLGYAPETVKYVKRSVHG